MSKCFVIQPFDNGRFDKRYEDTYKHAIEAAGLTPYRIDKDISVRIPIDEIEEGIASATICFAEITSDNPNVWYELGYAFACGKDVVMVCSDEREGQYPFDIRHRHIVIYKTSSKSDFEALESTITEKIKALLHKSKTVSSLNTTPVVDQEGLKANEVAMIILIAESEITPEDSVTTFQLGEQMGRAGYTGIAASLGLKSLVRKGMVDTSIESDWNNNTYTTCRLTKAGEDWLFANQDKLVFRKETATPSLTDSTPQDDDLPF